MGLKALMKAGVGSIVSIVKHCNFWFTLSCTKDGDSLMMKRINLRVRIVEVMDSNAGIVLFVAF